MFYDPLETKYVISNYVLPSQYLSLVLKTEYSYIKQYKYNNNKTLKLTRKTYKMLNQNKVINIQKRKHASLRTADICVHITVTNCHKRCSTEQF